MMDAKRWLVGLWCLFTWCGAGASSGAVIQGRVLDADTGRPLPFTSVQLEGESTRTGTPADEDGRFQFRRLDAGEYRLRYLFIGYITRSDTVTVAARDTLSLTVRLRSEGFQVEAVEVTGEREREARQQPAGSISLDIEELKAIPAVGEADPIRALQFLPGVQAASDISSGLYIRGGGPDQTLILLDQVPIYNPTHAFGLFSTFNSDAVNQVDLYKSVYPAEYTGRLGSVLDVRNREGDRQSLSGVGGVSVISGRMLLEGPVQNGSWLISGRRTYLDPLLDALRETEEQIPDYYFYDLNGKLTLNVGESDVLRVTGYQGRDRILFDLAADTNLNLRWGNTVGGVQYNRLLTDALLGSVQFSVSEYTSEVEARFFDTPFRIENSLRDISLRGDLQAELGSEHVVKAGLQGSLYNFTYKQEFNEDAAVDFKLDPSDVTAYVEDTWTREEVGDVLRGGLRARFFSEGERFLLEPRLGYSRPLDDRWTLKMGAGLYHQYLQLVSTEGFSAGDFYFPVDETAEPGQAWQGALGFTYEPNLDYEFSAETYYTDLSRLLVFDNDATVERESPTTDDIFITDGEGYAVGLELFAQKRTGAVQGWVGYTLGWTRRTFDELNAGKTFPPKYDRRHDLNVIANYTTGPWRFGASFVYGTGQAFTPASARYGITDPALGGIDEGGFVLPDERNSARLLPYHRLDLSVTREFGLLGTPAEWFIQIFNVYSRRNEWFIQFDSADPANEPEIVRQLPVIPTVGVNFAF